MTDQKSYFDITFVMFLSDNIFFFSKILNLSEKFNDGILVHEISCTAEIWFDHFQSDFRFWPNVQMIFHVYLLWVIGLNNNTNETKYEAS